MNWDNFRKYAPWWIFGILFLVCAAILGIFAPKYFHSITYAKTQEDRAIKAEGVSTSLTSQLMESLKREQRLKQVERVRYYPNGQKKDEFKSSDEAKSETVTMFQAVTVTQSVTVYQAVTITQTQTRTEVVEKRGGGTLGGGVNLDLTPAALVKANVLGPLGIGAAGGLTPDRKDKFLFATWDY